MVEYGVMNGILCIFLIIFSLTALAEEGNTSFEEIKQTIVEKHKALHITTSDSVKSQLCYELAVAYYLDQEIDKAFQYFLKALKTAPALTPIDMEKEESSLYLQALDDYLAQAGGDPIRVAKELLDKYGKVAKENREYLYLNFLIATAYANLGQYDDFFERFFQGFPYLHDSFLAYKTRGILYLRLSQHAINLHERHAYQEEAFHYLTLALDRNVNDSSLYKVLIFLAKDEKNDAMILTYLQKMVENKAAIPRGDIYLYVREAVTLQEFALGQEIIDQARAIYDYSRAISAAQEYLNQHRG